MEINTLNIDTSKEDERMSFFETLNRDGDWVIAYGKWFSKQIRKLHYKSENYNYYITQADSGEHTLYRNKKELT